MNVEPYRHARRVGDFIFVSGLGPRELGEPSVPGLRVDVGGGIVSHCIREQTRATIRNLKTVLGEVGASLADVVDVTIFLTQMQMDLAAFNEVYAEFFNEVNPARTTVEVTGLPTPVALEIKVIAYQPRPR